MIHRPVISKSLLQINMNRSLKSFGLIEAMISTFIILLFVSAIAFLSVKMVINYKKSISEDNAKKIAEEFLSRTEVLREFNRVSFDNGNDIGKIPISCFDSSKSISCQNFILDDFPLAEYPFGNFIRPGSDQYLEVNRDFIAGEKQKSYGYKINSKVVDISEDKKNVEIKIIWEDNGQKSFSTSFHFNNLK